jgi:drug/metabolite transporter (DMT)-like permease
VTLRKYAVLGAVIVFGAVGDAILSHGMRAVGEVTLSRWHHVIFAVLHPWVALGILFLLAFFTCYMVALSWADLTYVLPATSLGYVLLAFLAKFVLHEGVTATRWIGIVLISAGVGFVTRGPELTHVPPRCRAVDADGDGSRTRP